MLRRGDAVDEATEVTAAATTIKIRKRCALSSSGASDTLRKLRLKKRGVSLLGRKVAGGGVAVVSPRSSGRKMSESSWNRHCHADGARSSASARKLAGALRQMGDGSSPDVEAARAAHRRCASSVELSKRSRTRSKVLEADGQRSWHDGHGQWFSDIVSNGSTMEACSSPCTGGQRIAPHLHDMYDSLVASKELVRALANIWGDVNPSTASLLAALRSELDVARAHARHLAMEERRRDEDTERLRRRLVEEARVWRARQKEKVAATVQVAATELDGEKRSRRRAERVNAKLGRALADAERELERERTSRERLEKVCDELVRGGGLAVAGGDREEAAAVEEMRREAERAQEELEKEREMLHLADELREERVQMKMLEARLQFEEKSAVVEQLRGELEAFLDTKKCRQQEPPAAAAADERHHPSSHQSMPILAAVNDNGDEEDDEVGGGECGDDRSEGSEMHSIELNMDGGNSKDYSWSYTTSSRDMTTASKNAESSAHGSFSASDMGPDRAASVAFGHETGEELVGEERWNDDDDEGEEEEHARSASDRSKDVDEDAERYEAIKNLREQMLSGHGFVFLSRDGGDADSDRNALMRQIGHGRF